MKILTLEFSSAQRSVAAVYAASQGRRTFQVVELAPRHSMQPLGMVEQALKQAGIEREQIECIAVGLGPGSYTGIRIAIALAQGWQLARDVKLLGISSVEAIAAQAAADGMAGPISVIVDAQRGEFYEAGYEINAGQNRPTSALHIVSRDTVLQKARAGVQLIGTEVRRHFPDGLEVYPQAVTLGRLALSRTDFVPGDKLEPIYLRETSFVKAAQPRVVG